MNSRIVSIALIGAVVLGGTGIANAQVRYYGDQGQRVYMYPRGDDYDAWVSRRSPVPSERAGAANWGNESPPLHGWGRVDSHQQY